jgi:hypothetical protein
MSAHLGYDSVLTMHQNEWSAAHIGGYSTLALGPLITLRDKDGPSLDGFLQSESQTTARGFSNEMSERTIRGQLF